MKKLTFLEKDLEKYTLRDEQQKALDFFAHTLEKEPSKKFFLLDLPTGVGKSVLALSLIRHYIENQNANAKVDLLTNSRILQKQYTDEFVTPRNLWGKENYQCSRWECSCSSGAEFNKIKQSVCEDCPYEKSKMGWLGGTVSLTNFHLYCLYRLFVPTMFDERGSNVLIVDEAHDFDNIISDYITVSLKESTLKKLFPDRYTTIIKNVNTIDTIDQLFEFVSEFEKAVEDEITVISYDMKNSKTVPDKEVKRKRDLTGFLEKIKHFISDYQKMPANWILERTVNEKGKRDIVAEPIWSYPYLKKYVWDNYDHVILMSGTILNPALFAKINGIPATQIAYHAIPSPFLAKNRPIWYMPMGTMSYKEKVASWNRTKPLIKKLLKKYDGKKGIIHTHTYEITNWVMNDLKSKRFLTHDSSNRDSILHQHYINDKDTVLVSPSMFTGINLENDRSRFQLILKMPYPHLGSLKVQKRKEQMPEWYNWKTVTQLLQAYGRSIRNYKDYADTIITDSAFENILNYQSHLIPNWVLESVKFPDMVKVNKSLA